MSDPAVRPLWRRLLPWGLLLILLIPVPTGEAGIWMPTLFIFFDWVNNFLPENF